MRRATAVLIALTFSGGLAALGAPPRPRAAAQPVALRVVQIDTTIVATTTTTVAPTTTTAAPTTTTTAEPTTTSPPATAPPTTRATPPATAAPVTVARSVSPGPGGTGSLLSCLRWFESNDGEDPNLYQFDSGTWAAAFQAAIEQGLITLRTATNPDGVPRTSAANAERWVQDAAAQAWINAGHLRAGWLAQAGRCF